MSEDKPFKEFSQFEKPFRFSVRFGTSAYGYKVVHEGDVFVALIVKDLRGLGEAIEFVHIGSSQKHNETYGLMHYLKLWALERRRNRQ